MTSTRRTGIDSAMTFAPPTPRAPSQGDGLDGLLQALRPAYADEIASIKRKGVRQRRLSWLGRGAASGLAIMALVVLVTGWRSIEPDHHATLTHSLADGSSIFLDAGSAVEIPLIPWKREARLIRGDALFDIVHDQGNPFVVHAARSRLSDLGTRFLVQSEGEAVKVAVFEGKVEVTSQTGHKLALSAGQAAAAGEKGVVVLSMPDESESTAWRQGRLLFRETPLDQVAAKLSRYRAQPVVVGTPALARLKVNGSFRLDDLDGALRALEQALPVRVQDKGGVAVLEPTSRRH